MIESVLSNLDGLRLALTEAGKERFVAVITEQIRLIDDERDEYRARAESAESALIAMARGYCHYWIVNGEPGAEIYPPDHSGTCKEAFAHLVAYGLARWTDDRHYAIELVEGGAE